MNHRKTNIILTLLLMFTLSSCADYSEHAYTSTRPETEAVSIETRDNDMGNSLPEQSSFFGVFNERAVRIGDILYFSQYGAKDTPMIFAVDLKTMDTFPLCSKPECEHNSQTCSAFAGASGAPVSLTASEERLYYLDSSYSDVKLYRMEPDGSDRTEILVLQNKYEVGGNGYSLFAIHDDIIYRCCYRQTVEGAAVNNRIVLYRQAFDQDSPPAEMIQLHDMCDPLVAIDGQHLYLAAFKENRDEPTEMCLYEFDLNRDTKNELYSGSVSAKPLSLSVVNNQLLFGYGFSTFEFSLKDHQLKELPSASDDPDDCAFIGENTILTITSYTECCCIDYAGHVLYEGSMLPPGLENSEYGKEYVGCADDVYYFLLNGFDDPAEYGFLAFDANTFTSKILFSVSFPEGMGT